MERMPSTEPGLRVCLICTEWHRPWFPLGCRQISIACPSSTQHAVSIKEPIYHRRLPAKQASRVFGPFPSSTAPCVHINRFGVIPKKHQPGKWRLITDLSFPEGASMNDAIDPSLCSLTYVTVDTVAAAATSLGRHSLLAKIDVKSAYQLIPVHPSDCKWLGMQWQGRIYVDAMLPFGLRSAPKIFNAMADAMEWCVINQGV